MLQVLQVKLTVRTSTTAASSATSMTGTTTSIQVIQVLQVLQVYTASTKVTGDPLFLDRANSSAGEPIIMMRLTSSFVLFCFFWGVQTRKDSNSVCLKLGDPKVPFKQIDIRSSPHKTNQQQRAIDMPRTAADFHWLHRPSS